MKILFRCDASDNMGHGHVMRCLTLADACKQEGAQTTFITRAWPGNLGELVQVHGHRSLMLPAQNLDSSDTYSSWLGDTETGDAEACSALIGTERYDWIVTDHYGISANWHKIMRVHADRILALDDLANRSHDCDLLLDPTFARKTSAYRHKVPAQCDLLCGSQYALLQPRFSQLRLQRKPHARKLSQPALLVYLGGASQQQRINLVLDQIAGVTSCRNWHVHLLSCGDSAGFFMDKSQTYPFALTVHDFVQDMPGLLAQMDFAIGACGGSVWERAALGIASLLLVTAENQQTIADTLDRYQAAIVCRNIEEIGTRLPELQKLAWKLQLQSAALCDARGSHRVLSCMRNLPLDREVSLRPMLAEDSDYLFELQLQGENRKYFHNSSKPSREQHQHWLQTRLKATDSAHFIIQFNNRDCGYLRFDRHGVSAEVSIMVDTDFRSRGIARSALACAVEISGGMPLLASVHRENLHSLRLFANAGFTHEDTADTFLEMRR